MKNNKINLNLRKTFLSVVLTFALIELSEVGSGFVDVLITSRMLGSNQAGAMGLGYPLFSIVGMVSGLIALGMQSICSEEMGRGNIRKMNKCFSNMFFLGLFVAIVLMIIFLIFATPISTLLGAPKDNTDNLLSYTSDYLKGLSIGLVPLFLYPLLGPILQLDGNGKLVRIAVLSGTFVDIICNIVAIKLGMGVFGVGLASALSYYVTFIIMVTHFFKKERQLSIVIEKLDFKLLGNIISRGKNKAFKRLANIIRPIIINNYIISIGGTIAMSALSIRNNTADFFMVVNSGIASAIGILSGVIYTEKSLEDMKTIGKLSHRFIFLYNLPLAIICLCFSKFIASIMVTDSVETIELVSFAIKIFSIEMIVESLLASRISYLTAINHHKETTILTFGQKLFAIVPFVFLLGSTIGVKGIIMSFACAYLFMLLFELVIILIKSKKINPSIKDHLLLDDSFTDSPKDTIELNVRDSFDASLVSEQIQMFCKGHKFDEAKGYFSALCLDEVSNYLIKDSSGSCKLDLLVRIIEDDIILRFRFTGTDKNPFIDKKEDDLSLIGIKAIQKKSKEIKFFRVFKINYVVVRI